jgi:hypothetical protein
MTDLVPKPVAGVEMEMLEGEILLYHLQRERAVYLNPTGAVIWGLCDGKRSVSEIVRLIGDTYPDAVATLQEDVRTTLEKLQESGVLVLG